MECLVSDPDCGSPGGVDYYCGVSDGFCPEDFYGVSCSTGDADCWRDRRDVN
ncbi:MAG: hypothetical protein JW724_01980 [Candidatus Altiarchaeota archaeon]|nr:hypothetical protein [Candidatus Altiarchaeota archaeon]